MSLDPEMLNSKISGHVTKHVGKINTTYSDPMAMMTALMTGGVPVDVIHTLPSKERPFHTLVTVGMSQEPLPAPKEMKEFRHVELALCLPESWQPPKDVAQGKVNESNWPVQMLMNLAQGCHAAGRFLMFGTVIPNGDELGNLKPFAPRVRFHGSVIWAPVIFGSEFLALPIKRGVSVLFLQVICLKKDEVESLCALDYGELVDKLNDSAMPYVADPARKSVW